MTPMGNETVEPNKILDAADTSFVWRAIYTRPRHERAVATQLGEPRVETFLPMQEKVRRWKDRKKLVLFPLFPSYLFVRSSLSDHFRVLQLAGVVRFVSFGSSPAIIPEAELQCLRGAMENGVQVQAHRYLKVGRLVRVWRGPLQDTEG